MTITLLGPTIESNTLIALSYNVYNYANFIMHYNRVIGKIPTLIYR